MRTTTTTKIKESRLASWYHSSKYVQYVAHLPKLHDGFLCDSSTNKDEPEQFETNHLKCLVRAESYQKSSQTVACAVIGKQ